MKLIRNALIWSRRENSEKLVNLLFNDKLIRISETSDFPDVSEEYDLKGKLLIPGCIDPHVHFNDPGYPHRESFYSGTAAAACGGITTVIDMPCTSVPPVTSQENLEKKIQAISRKALVDFALWGGIRGNDLPIKEDQLLKLWDSGIIGFKIYTISGMDSFSSLTYQQIHELLTVYPQFLYGFHAEDKDLICRKTNELTAEEIKTPQGYILSRPAAAEVQAVHDILQTASSARIHFVHISSKAAAEEIIRNKQRLDLSFETCPHYLQFTQEDLNELKGRLKTAPPVKSSKDKEFLRSQLNSGPLDLIASDHAGCDYQQGKTMSDFSRVYNGIPGTELMIPYLFSEFYFKGTTSLSRMIDLTSRNAALRFGLYPQKGDLIPGSDADFTIIDPEKEYQVKEDQLHSLGKYSPFNNMKFKCSIHRTYLRGNPVFTADNGILADPGYGIWIRRI